jgi:hypothetical protein
VIQGRNHEEHLMGESFFSSLSEDSRETMMLSLGCCWASVGHVGKRKAEVERARKRKEGEGRWVGLRKRPKRLKGRKILLYC